jgi:signal peptidase I
LVAQGYKPLWKNEYFRTIVTVLIIVVVVLGFWYGLRWGLNTDYPVLAVASGSMSLPKGVPDPGWSSPFSPTLHTGDLIVVQGVSASDIHPGSPPVGDILVFHVSRGSDELIVHRAIGKTTIDGTIYFITQGDANSEPGPPDTPGLPAGAVPISDVVGKVVMRVPWLGYIALDMRNSTTIFVIVILIIVFIIVESVVSEVEHKRTHKNENEPPENVPKPEDIP